jgi:hypothetical protein
MHKHVRHKQKRVQTIKQEIIMKKGVLIITLIGLSIGIKAQNTFPKSGNVGIGTTSPNHKLDINTGGGNLKTYSYGLEHTVNTTGGWARGFRLRNENDNKTTVFGSLNGAAYISTGFDINSDATGYQNQKFTVLTNGNVGIGTTETGNHKLAVEGSIGAREIKVEATGWSDFVFYDNYKLPTLNEVENHIKEKGHLKDIPSAKEVAENGIYLGEMDSKLLQKIEELTLYTIAQEKKIKELETLNTKFIELQKRMEKLEKE